MNHLKPNKELRWNLAIAALKSARQTGKPGGYLLHPNKLVSNSLVAQFMLADIELYEKSWKHIEEKERRKEIAEKCSEFFSKLPYDSRRPSASGSAARTRESSKASCASLEPILWRREQQLVGHHITTPFEYIGLRPIFFCA